MAVSLASAGATKPFHEIVRIDAVETTMDRAGRVAIPKAIRDAAGLRPGAAVTVTLVDGKVELAPASREVKAVKRGNGLVLSAPKGTPPLTVDQTRGLIERVRRGER